MNNMLFKKSCRKVLYRSILICMIIAMASCSEQTERVSQSQLEDDTMTASENRDASLVSKVLEIEYFNTHDFYYGNSWLVTSGQTNYMFKSSASAISSFEVQVDSGKIYGFGFELRDPDRTDEAILLISSILGNELNYLTLKSYLTDNIQKTIYQITEAQLYRLPNAELRAGNVAFTVGSTRINTYIGSVDISDPIKL